MTTYNPAALPDLVAAAQKALELLPQLHTINDEDEQEYFQPLRAALALARQHPSTTCPVCSYPFAQPYCPRCDAVALAGQLCTHCYTCGRLYPASGACPSDHSELAQARERIAKLERLASELLSKYKSEAEALTLAVGSKLDLSELDAEIAAYRTRLQS